jgi:hypothetical protein
MGSLVPFSVMQQKSTIDYWRKKNVLVAGFGLGLCHMQNANVTCAGQQDTTYGTMLKKRGRLAVWKNSYSPESNLFARSSLGQNQRIKIKICCTLVSCNTTACYVVYCWYLPSAKFSLATQCTGSPWCLFLLVARKTNMHTGGPGTHPGTLQINATSTVTYLPQRVFGVLCPCCAVARMPCTCSHAGPTFDNAFCTTLPPNRSTCLF